MIRTCGCWATKEHPAAKKALAEIYNAENKAAPLIEAARVTFGCFAGLGVHGPTQTCRVGR